jgi:hypothetical protein
LSQSKTIEFIWGRDCPNLGSRGFVALSKMPALRGLGVSCKNVDDEALSTLPRFPALRELTPIGVKDDGFRHIGQCERLERLTCMYCRDTTDAATEHIARLQLKYYYAGLTLITDRSLEVLGGMTSLEQVELYECNGSHRCRPCVPGGPTSAARGPFGRAARSDAGRHADLPRASTREVFNVTLPSLEWRTHGY